MPYRARQSMTLGTYQVAKGSLVPDAVLAAMPESRFGSLVRTGLLQHVLVDEEPPEYTPEPDGEICPECGEGPFKRLAKHIDAKHPVE